MYTCRDYYENEKRILSEKISVRKTDITVPKVVIIQIGDEPASNSYIKGKVKDCNDIGIEIEVLKYKLNATQYQIERVVNDLNHDDSVHGIVVQLPVPKWINMESIRRIISPKKDVDGFNPYSLFKPCTALGIINYLKFNNYSFEGKAVTVIGRSMCVGHPLVDLLLDSNATVTVCHSKSNPDHIKASIRHTDLVITSIDKIEYYKEGFFDDVVHPIDIIDVGLGYGEDGKLHGNIEASYAKQLKERAEETGNYCISGINGVGLLTRISLMHNIFDAYDNFIKDSKPYQF